MVKSPSGKTTLWVNPSEPYLPCTSTCIVKQDGKVLWTKQIPFSFEACGVTDDGIAGGYGYLPNGKNDAQLALGITNRSGKLTIVKKLDLNKEQIVDSTTEPYWAGLIFDPKNDRLVARIAGLKTGDQLETWWVYSLSNANLTSTILPRCGEAQPGVFVTGAQLINGTDLILTSWYRYDSKTQKIGQFFTLIDPSSKIVWRQDFPDDLKDPSKDERSAEAWNQIRGGQAIVNTEQPLRFEIRSAKHEARISYEVKRAGTGWTVSEVSRRPFVAPVLSVPPVPEFKLNTSPLRVTKTVVIPRPALVATAIHDVGPFEFWGNRIVFLRGGKNPALCVTDLSGHLIRQVPLPKVATINSRCFLARTAGSHFVLFSTTNITPTKSYAWTFDAASGTCQSIPKFHSYWIRAVSGYKNGLFAVSSSEFVSSTIVEHLTLHAPNGSTIWDKDSSGPSEDKEELGDPEDVAFDSSGRIVVLDNFRHFLQVFASSGRFRSSIALDKSMERNLSYPTHITCLPDGNYWLIDMSDKPCFQLDHKGKVIRNFLVQYVNGRQMEFHDAIRVDTQSRPWITNGTTLDRVDSHGKVVQTIGQQPRTDGLGKISRVVVSPNGNIYIVDGETSGVHVFSRNGHPLFTCQPAPKEFQAGSARLDVTRTGDIFLDGSERQQILHYSPSGKRLGYESSPKEKAPEMPIEPKPNWRWWFTTLIDDKEKAVFQLRRFPDQSWMQGELAVAPDGRIASYAHPPFETRKESIRKVAFYTAAGRPESQALLPAEMPDTYGCAYDGNQCYFVTEKGLLAVDRQGKFVWRYQPTGWATDWKVFPSLGKLALFDGDHTVRWIEKESPR